MSTSTAHPASRFRRRIIGIGTLVTGALYVIGAPIFNSRIESDLESRVPAELAAAGFDAVTAEFSGQDGTLSCNRPLDDPEGARAAAFAVRGVRTVVLERSCRVLTAAPDPDEGSQEKTGALTAADASSEPAGSEDEIGDETSEGDASTSPSIPTPTTEAEMATISEVVAADPNLTFLSVLLAEEAAPSADAPVTLFAPTNEAFDALPSDVAARLQSDAELRAAFLAHHTVAGSIMSADLVDGTVVALDGSELTVVTGDVAMVDGASLIDADIAASNGVVHVIDRVLVTDALELPADAEAAPAAVSLADSRLTVTGVVASEVQRNALVAAAVAAVGVDFVIDDTTVAPDTGIGSETAGRLAVLIAAMPPNLLSGEVGFDGSEVYASGVYRSEEARDAFAAAAVSVEVEAMLDAPPDATADQAVELEAQLNEFVAQNPILFEPSSDVLSASAFAVIERVATDVQAFTGVAITVEGHTDSDGVASENLRLSRERADAVRAALVDRGVAAETIDATGFGNERPILVDGVENKAASRRVEFRVVTTS